MCGLLGLRAASQLTRTPRLTSRNDIGSNLTRLNKSFNAAVGSAQSRLLPQGRRFAELAGQSGEIDLSDPIDELVREIQAGR